VTGPASRLSVATVAGLQRDRLRELLAALAAQTIAAEIEVVVVDTRPELGVPEPPAGLRVRTLPGGSLSFGEARAEAARAASAPIVAFLEDHCYPEPGWAAAVAAAYREPWASVGYAFENANPETRSSRIAHLAHYGEWESPQRGAATALPANNVSYRREVLLELGADLPAMLMADFNLHAELRRRGQALATEPAARARHENTVGLLEGCRGSLVYSRVVAAERARLAGWAGPRRLLRAVAALGLSPLARLGGLIAATRRRPARLLAVLAYLPAILAVYLSSALGESIGYARGVGPAAAGLMELEVEAPREPVR
jgi:Glycosyltransferase like family 2